MSDGAQVIGTIIGGMIGFAIGGLAGAARGAALGYQLTAPREDASPSYSFSAAQNTKSQEIPVPIVYGENRVAGNIIFQKISESDDQKMDIQLAISEGPIESISDIKANDVDISSYSKIKLGERTQAADSINTNGETFPYLAYISASLDAGELELSGTPTITSISKGRKVDCWNGSGWTNKYTKNPVWCLYDFIKNKRYSLGIKDSSIDIASFKSIAEYCDELVDGEPRFELDYVIDSKRPSLDHLQEILATFRSFIIYSGGELRLKVDGLENPVQSFDASNIVKGSFRYSKSSRKDMPNRVMVQYIDPDNHWAKAYAVYADDQDIRERGEVITKEVRLYGVQRFNQAGRMARYFQKQAKYCSTFCEFKAGIDSLQCEVGDVVTISHEVSGWVDKKFRIMEITEEQNDEMKISCREYHDAVYSDDGVVYQTKKDSTLPNPFEKPASVSNLNLVEHNEVLGDGTWIPGIKVTWTKPGEIFWKAGHVYISDDDGATWNFLQRVEEEKLIIKDLAPRSYKVKVVSENKRGVKEDFSTAPISSLTVIGKDVSPSDVTWGTCSFDRMVRLSWQPIPDVDRKFYEVRTDMNFGSKDSALVFRGDALSVVLTPKQRSYTFYISAMDRSGNYSENASSITLTNSAPPTPPLPKVTEFFQSIWIEIEPVPDNDIEKYTVYITPSDGAGTPIGLVELKPVATAPNKITYNANPGESFLIQVSAWDVMGEGAKSSTVEASTKFVNAPDIPDGLLEESKLVSSLKSKINIAKSQSDDYANQVIAYPTEEDEDNQSTVNYKLKYSAGDIYVGTEVETDPNAFFDLTDQNNDELLDAEGNVVKVVDIRDENWAQLIGSGKATWHGGEEAESVNLVLSAVPANPKIRVSYGVKKMLKDLAVDGLLKKGVTAKQIDANLVDALENMKGFAWNETVPAGMKLIDVASRITNNEGTLTSHQTSIAKNASDIQSTATRVTIAENNIAANQTAIDQNADDISLKATKLEFDNLKVGGRNLLKNSDKEVTSTKEFVRYADLAPIIDKNGLVEYTISFDIKSLDISNQSTMMVYMQNGNGSKYEFTKHVDVTTEFTRQFISVIPTLIDDSITESYLAFYGTYDTGNIATVKNVKVELGNMATDWTPAPEDVQDQIDENTEEISINSGSIQINADGIQQTVTEIESANKRINERSIAIPDNAILFRFDDNLMSTRQVKPIEAVATLRPHEGKYGGAVAVEDGTDNLLSNPPFQGESGVASDFGMYGGGACEYSIVPDCIIAGTLSQRVQYTSPAEDGLTMNKGILFNTPNLVIAEEYTFSFYGQGWDIKEPISFYGGSSLVLINKTKKIVNNKWTYYEVTYQALATNATIFIRPNYNRDYSFDVLLNAPRFEKKPFATSFVSGTRSVGRLRYTHGLDMNGQYCFGGWIKPNVDVQRLMDASMQKYGHNYGYRAILDLHPSAGGRYDMWWGTEKTFHLGTGIDVGGSTMYVGDRMATKDDWVFFVVVGDGHSTKLYVGLDGEIDSATRIRTGDVISEEIWLDGYSGSYQGTNLIDEFFAIPNYAPSLETIKTWYESKAPFYDSMQTELQASQVTQLANEYTVKIQQHANGKEVISGFGLATDKEGLSEFGVLADRFKIYGDIEDSEETATPIFVLDTESKKLYLLSDLIADGTITARMLASAELITESAQIKNGIIDDAKIANLEADKITTSRAKIKSAQIESIETSQIKVGGQPAKIINPKPQGAKLWQFDMSMVSTDGVKPINSIATLRPYEGKYGGAVAVEEGTENLLHGLSGVHSKAEDIPAPDSFSVAKRFTLTAEYGYVFTSLNIPAQPNTAYTLTYYARLVSGEVVHGTQMYIGSDSQGTYGVVLKYLENDLSSSWKKFSITGTTDAAATELIRGAFRVQTNTNCVVEIADWQLEQKPFATSFVNGIRAAGKLYYDYEPNNWDEFTIAAWTKRNDISNWGSVVSAWGNFYFMWMIGSLNTIRFSWIENDSQRTIQGAISTIDCREWNHVACTYDKSTSTAKIYINGEKVAAKTDVVLDNIFSKNGLAIGTLGITSSAYPLNGLIDEVLISPIAHTPETIKTWYESKTPFFDSPSCIGVGKSTIISEKGIITTDLTTGNYSVYNSGGLSFYEAGNPEPWWYTKRVVRGEVEDGTFVPVPWWTSRTKIITAVKNLVTYNPQFPDDVQMYYTEAEHDVVNGVPGYWVYGKCVIPKGHYGPYDINKWVPYGGNQLKTLDSKDQTTKVRFCVEVMKHWSGTGFTACDVYLVRTSDNAVINSKMVKNNQSYRYFYGVFDNLAPGQYYLKYTASADHFVFRWWEYWAYTVVHGSEVPIGDNQEKPMVAYIIIEGGK